MANNRWTLMAAMLITSLIAACESTGESPVVYKYLLVDGGTAIALDGNTVLFKGSPLALSGPGVKVGDPLQDAKVTQTDLTLINVVETKGKGKIRIISIVPSLDTPVCEQQTHYLS